MYMAVTKPLLSPDRLVGVANALRRDRAWVTPSVVVAACLHGGVALVLPRFDQAARSAEASTEMIDVETANPPRPLPEPEPPPALVAEPREARSTTAAKGTTPSAAAQAGRILAREPSPDEALDLTGFVQGVGATYAGGTIRAAGGRVLAVCATGETLKQARDRAYAAVDEIDWPTGFCRRDIGWRALTG